MACGFESPLVGFGRGWGADVFYETVPTRETILRASCRRSDGVVDEVGVVGLAKL